jgi:hypothetical protein
MNLQSVQGGLADWRTTLALENFSTFQEMAQGSEMLQQLS